MTVFILREQVTLASGKCLLVSYSSLADETAVFEYLSDGQVDWYGLSAVTGHNRDEALARAGFGPEALIGSRTTGTAFSTSTL
jgi:hypothetical protein